MGIWHAYVFPAVLSFPLHCFVLLAVRCFQLFCLQWYRLSFRFHFHFHFSLPFFFLFLSFLFMAVRFLPLPSYLQFCCHCFFRFSSHPHSLSHISEATAYQSCIIFTNICRDCVTLLSIAADLIPSIAGVTLDHYAA